MIMFFNFHKFLSVITVIDGSEKHNHQLRVWVLLKNGLRRKTAKGVSLLTEVLYLALSSFTTVALNSLSTDKSVALRFLIKLKFGRVQCFWEGKKTWEPGENPLEQGRETATNSIHWHMTPGPVIRSRRHYAIVPFLLPSNEYSKKPAYKNLNFSNFT